MLEHAALATRKMADGRQQRNFTSLNAEDVLYVAYVDVTTARWPTNNSNLRDLPGSTTQQNTNFAWEGQVISWLFWVRMTKYKNQRTSCINKRHIASEKASAHQWLEQKLSKRNTTSSVRAGENKSKL